MMRFQKNVLFALLSVMGAKGFSEIGNSEAKYQPTSAVTDHAAIDLDQKSIQTALSIPDFLTAEAIYSFGGHSKSYASINLSGVLNRSYLKGTEVTGQAIDGSTVTGKLYSAAEVGTSILKVQYATSNNDETYSFCRVGGLPTDDQVTSGCLTSTGSVTLTRVLTVTIATESYGYTYDPTTENENGRTIKGFSTSAEKKMGLCTNCPYNEYDKYFQYYGMPDYADHWINAALTGGSTTFSTGNFNQNFAEYQGVPATVGRVEAAKKGTAYMAVYMYVLREFEDAYDDCLSGCIGCNDDSVHAWDEGVAFYTGSQQSDESGYLLFSLANKRCSNFKTCGVLGNTNGDLSIEEEAAGVTSAAAAKVNHDLFAKFDAGRDILAGGGVDNCELLPPLIDEITDIMTVPLIQGTLRYAYKVGLLGDGEKGKAEGAVFAAAVLPHLWKCSSTDAEIVASNMGFNSGLPDFAAVKSAFEANYDCMGVTCAQIGGLLSGVSTGNIYYEGAQPCVNID